MATMRGALVAIAAAAAAVAALAASPAIAAPLPVPQTFFSGVGPELANPGGALPGVNEWDCEPSPAHPNPVVLVHGQGGGAQTNWGSMAPRLKNAGHCVYALTYGALPGSRWPVSALGGLAPMEHSAGELASFIDRVLDASGARRVDIVGHSEGTLMPNYYVQNLGGAAKVDHYVSLAPEWLGGGPVSEDPLAGLTGPTGEPLCAACAQQDDGSAFLQRMHERGLYAPEVTYTNIMTRYDEFVTPYTNGHVEGPNATNIVVQGGCDQDFSDHLAVAASVRAQQYVLNALDPAHALPVPCVFVAPVLG